MDKTIFKENHKESFILKFDISLNVKDTPLFIRRIIPIIKTVIGINIRLVIIHKISANNKNPIRLIINNKDLFFIIIVNPFRISIISFRKIIIVDRAVAK